MKRLVRLLVTAVTCSSARVSFAQQASDTISDQVSCARCKLEVSLGPSLGARDTAIQFATPPNAVIVDRLGRYWVLAGGEPPRVFRADGSFVAQFGARGPTQDDYGRPIELQPLPGDSILVIDPTHNRARVVTLDGRTERQIAIPNVTFRALPVAWPTSVVINGSLTSSLANGWPLHEASMTGAKADIGKSFGSDSGYTLVGQEERLFRWLTRNAAGGFWTSDVGRYRLQLWSDAGELRKTIIRAADWFPIGTLSPGGPTTPPAVNISAIAQDKDGLVWVFIRMPAPTWREAWPHLNPTKGATEISIRGINLEKLYQTRVEVLDPRAGTVVVRRDVPYWVIAALPGRTAAASVQGANGARHIQILTFTIAPGRR